MNDLQIFSNPEFGQIRTVQLNNETYFVGKNVAEILGYANPNEAIQDHIDEEDKLNSKTLSSFELDLGQRGGWLINESGLYSLILLSKLPSARKFKRWVTSEVLPTIRKTGAYQKPMNAIELMELHYEAIKEVDCKVIAVDQDLQDFKRDMPILGIEESRITSAVKKKGVQCLGGKASVAYNDKSLRAKVYADIYGQLKREFGVETYKAIKRGMCEKAVRLIAEYEPPLVLKDQIRDYNAQMRIDA